MIAPVGETVSAGVVAVVLKVTVPGLPFTWSWALNVADVTVETVAVTGGAWVRVVAVTVRVKVHVPESPNVSATVPDTV